jgi:glycosyltransferase involved in cell wall biosynthesis
MAPAPRLYLDLQAAQSAAHAERGIARYSVELTRALLRGGAPVDTIALSPHLPPPRGLPADVADSPTLGWRTSASLLDAARRGPFAYVLLSPIELELPTRRTIPEAAITRADALVAVVYDLIPLVFADRYLASPQLRAAYEARLALVRQADLLLTISEHTRRDVVQHLDVPADRVRTIGGGVSPWFSPGAVSSPRPRPYVLSVSGWEWRKNTERLIHAFGRLAPEVREGRQLVIACAVPPEGERAWHAEAEAAGLDDGQLVVTGYVDDDQLRSLYRGAELFVFPSLYEGFGLPVAEAACCGAPVLTSSSSSLPEILDLPSSTFDAGDVDDMARVLGRGLTDADFRAELLAASALAADVHTWDAVAERTQRALAQLGRGDAPSERSRRRRRPPMRVAIAGPLPPIESGVAVYNERVVDALVTHPDIELHLFADGAGGERPVLDLDVPVHPIEALDGPLDPHDYDVFVHTIGNQRWHVRGFDFARRHPGILWLHDASLVGLHLEWALWQIRTVRSHDDVLGILRAEIRELYDDRVPPELVLAEPLSHRAFVANEVHLVAGLVRAAQHLVVNSSLAFDMARVDLGPAGRCPPATVLHHAVPALPQGFRREPDAAPLVVALGVVHAVKRPDVLVAAFAQLHAASRLAFVGPCDDGARALVTDAAQREGVAERVTITGHVEMADYWRWLERAHIAVQLREPTFGESSGAVHDAIAARVPVVTSIAACRDLPTDVVQMVTPDVAATDLAVAVRALLGDRGRLARMRDAQAAFGAEWSFARVADELATVIRQTVLARLAG